MVGVSVLEAAKIIENRHDPALVRAAILLTAQSTTNHLHVSHRAEHLPRDEHHIYLWRIEAGREDGVVAQYPDVTPLEAAEELAHVWGGELCSADRSSL